MDRELLHHWQSWAACRGVDPNLFVPEQRGTQPPPVVATLCPTCPVRQNCEAYGRATMSVGWWGGRYLSVYIRGRGRRQSPQPPVRVKKKQRSKLTVGEIAEIRSRWAEGGILQRELAAEYGAARTTITMILGGQRRPAAPVGADEALTNV